MDRRRRSLGGNERGFVLIALIALLTMGGLYFFIRNLTPDLLQARQQQQTGGALTQARDALMGYAVRFREEQLQTGTAGLVYGYLPLPDLGTTRNNNTGCTGEGCDAANFAGNALNVTVIGRFPWRTLGTGPLRDAQGECLWYAVSGSHQRIQRTSPMNWDTLSQLDVVVANGTASMVSAITSAHDRPIAVIFSPGPPLGGQDRSASTTDNVTECGGNYVVSNYLDPILATDLGGITNYLAGTANNASGDTSAANKPLSAGGVINRRSDGKIWAGNCPPNDASACAIVANDTGATVTSELLFRTLRGSSYFRTDINTMLDRMTSCLRDQVAAGSGFIPAPLTGFTPPTDKNVGRIPTSACYDDTQNPLGYFSHYRDQVFVASRIASDFTVTVDGAALTCPATIIFGSQRGTGQSRSTTAERNSPASYLEGINLTGFISNGALGFAGPSQFAQVSATQIASQDIVRCVPTGASLNQVASPVLASLGLSQLTNYDAATRTLTLGAVGVTIAQVGAANAKALFGCSWTPESHSVGSGLRSYFKFNIANTGEGFTFAIIDGDRNGSDVCGTAQQHLGYSGNNTATPFIAYPKIGIEVDTTETAAQKSAFNPAAANTLTNGRSDPNYTGGHVAIVYWGAESPYATGNTFATCTPPKYWNAGVGACYLPQEEDDNVHGLPTPPSASLRPPPRNPAAPATPATSPAGVNKLDPGLSQIPTNIDVHVRVEVSKVSLYSLASVRVATQTTIDLSNPGASLDGIAMNNGDRVLVTAQSTSADNGIYTWNGAASAMARATDANTATALLKATTQVTAGTLAGTSWLQTETITALDTDRINWVPNQNVSGYLVESWILADSVTVANQIAAMQDTTRSMSQLSPAFIPQLRDSPLVFDIQGGACPCGAGQTCGTDNMCYTKAFQSARLGFTNSQSTAARDQVINITNFATTWLP